MLAEMTREEIDAALEGVVREVLVEAHIARPPVDALLVARRLGIHVLRDERQEGRARYVRLKPSGCRAPRPTILLRGDPRPERRQWAVAHELGEHCAARVFAAWGVDPRVTPSTAREQTANRFAAWLLLPGDWYFAAARECDADLATLKARFCTASHELIARRALDRDDPPAVVTIFDHSRLGFRRGNSGATPSLSSAERACQRQAHATGEACRRQTDVLIVRAWPIHEPGWRREIVRAEPIELWS